MSKSRQTSKTRVLIVIDNGRVEEVITSHPIEVEIIDRDIDGAENTLLSPKHGEYYVYEADLLTKNDKKLDEIWDQIQRSRK